MIMLAAGIVVFRISVPSSQAMTLLGSGLTDLDLARPCAGAVRRRILFAAANLQRVFAIVELFRAVAAFMVAPIFIHFAAATGGGLDAGTPSRCGSDSVSPSRRDHRVVIYIVSGARPRHPPRSLLSQADPAWESPPLFAKIRRNAPELRSRQWRGASTESDD